MAKIILIKFNATDGIIVKPLKSIKYFKFKRKYNSNRKEKERDLLDTFWTQILCKGFVPRGRDQLSLAKKEICFPVQ